MNLHSAGIVRKLEHMLDVKAIDITNDLVLQTSYYMANQMKAYNYSMCGWVHDLGSKVVLNHRRLVFARVNECA